MGTCKKTIYWMKTSLENDYYDFSSVYFKKVNQRIELFLIGPWINLRCFFKDGSSSTRAWNFEW